MYKAEWIKLSVNSRWRSKTEFTQTKAHKKGLSIEERVQEYLRKWGKTWKNLSRNRKPDFVPKKSDFYPNFLLKTSEKIEILPFIIKNVNPRWAQG
jgi:hypothetical protein